MKEFCVFKPYRAFETPLYVEAPNLVFQNPYSSWNWGSKHYRVFEKPLYIEARNSVFLNTYSSWNWGFEKPTVYRRVFESLIVELQHLNHGIEYFKQLETPLLIHTPNVVFRITDFSVKVVFQKTHF